MSGDIDRTVRALVAHLDTPPYPASKKWPSPILCVFDTILALDRRKPGWIEETIQRLQEPDFEYGTLESARDYAGAFPSPVQFFHMDLRDNEAKRAGVLLPLVDALIDGLRDFPAVTEGEQARTWATAARPSDWSFGPFRGLGLKGFQHLRQLFGANTVIPSQEHMAFVAKAVGRAVDAVEAVYLLERAASRLRYDLAGIPGKVWARTLDEASTGDYKP